MKREQAEQIARSVLTAVNADTSWPSVNHVAGAIIEAVAVEREACAKVCDAQIDSAEQAKSESRAIRDRDSVNEIDSLRHAQAVRLYNAAVMTCADAIRARGNE